MGPIWIYASDQNPSKLDPTVMDNARNVLVFRLTEDRDLDIVAPLIPRPQALPKMI